MTGMAGVVVGVVVDVLANCLFGLDLSLVTQTFICW